jgi:hypothetical protein
MRLSGQKTLGVGIYASTPRGRRQETPSSHDMGCRNFTQGKGKQGVLRVVDQLRRYSCSKKETSDASNHVLISMWKVAEERKHGQEAIEHLPEETVAHIQSAGCRAPRKSVIGAHNRCWKYLLCAITKDGEAKQDVEFIGEDKDRQLESLWRETKIGDVLP